jgi:DNA-binding NarL/FixJ family response regulator
MGDLGPIYLLLGKGLNDGDIAKELHLTEVNVKSCVGWLIHFLKIKDRQELAVYALAA